MFVAGSAESASLVSDYPVQEYRENNSAPEFNPTAVTRAVSEGEMGMAVGDRVTATDADSGALNYTIGTNVQIDVDGTATDVFELTRKTGQITTAIDLDYDADADPNQTSDFATATGNGAGDNIYLISVTATDSAGVATATPATVTIELKNVDEKPTFDATGNPPTITVAENLTALSDTDSEVTYTATDPEDNRVSLSLMGTDGSMFMLSSVRVLSFRMAPDFENPTDANKDNVYQVTVRASDGVMYEDRMVMVTVTNVDEGPEITEVDSPIEYAEGGTDPVATFTAMDPEGDTVTWSADTGADQALFTIDEDDGTLTFNTPPDYEGDGTDNDHEVTVTASSTGTSGIAITDTFDLAVEVTDEKRGWGGDLDHRPRR